jgi:putative spermidine/putrescine transport system permease protein
MIAVSPYVIPSHHLVRRLLYLLCAGVLAFLVLPILAIIPLSFNAGSLLTYPLAGVSLRWYRVLLESPQWTSSLRNSVLVASGATALATPVGTLAALGLARLRTEIKPLITALLLAPMFTPAIVVAVATYLLYARVGLVGTFLGLVFAHATLAAPFVVLVVHAALQGFDVALTRAAASLGANPLMVWRRVLVPLLAPGVTAGAIFAFMTSFDEIVVAMFLAGPEQRTLPLRMFEGVREQINPTITAAATLLSATSAVLLGLVEMKRRQRERAREVRA